MKDVKSWSHSQMDDYIDSNIEGFTIDQVGHMAWYLGIRHEQMLQEKQMTEENESDDRSDDFRIVETDLVR